MSRYTGIFNEALTAYLAQTRRPGFERGYFTIFRHSCQLYPALVELQRNLNTALSDEASQNLIITHLMNKNNKHNTHSFNSYFIDALQKNDETCDWTYFEKNKVKTYNGIVYRGMGRGPEIVFRNGLMTNQSSTLLSDYRLRCNHSVGISTSKSYETAVEYAKRRIQQSHDKAKPIYVYKIDYRGSAGVDIKHSNPKNMILDIVHHVDWKAEVNIMTEVALEDIVGVYVLRKNGNTFQKQWVDNPSYVKIKEIETLPAVTLREKVFSM